MSEEYNGYLDADQTFGNYYVRELGGTFAQLQEADPSLLLRQWWKLRKAAQSTSIGTTILGGAALAGGVLIGAPLLMGAGAIVGLGSGFLAWHHGKGATAHQQESEILDNCPLLVPFLCKLEESKLPRSELIAAYDTFIKAVFAGHIDPNNQQQIKGWFQARIEQRAAFTQAATEFVQTQNGTSPIAPALTDAPMENGVKEHELTLPQSQPAVALTDALVADNNDSRPPTPIATPQRSPVDYLIGNRLRTALIVSVSGGGKDILLSNALRQFLAAYPGFRVVVADCKDDPKEYGYYAALPNVSVHRLNVAVASDGEVIEWVDQWVSEFVHLPQQALLICNEGTLIRAKSKRYVQVIDGLVSSGDSRQKYCWEAGQSAHTDDLQINGAARSRFRTLIIGLKGEEMQIEAVLSAKFVADSARNMQDIKTQMMRSPVSRAWCDGQAWYAMPKLENYSGYDRDSRSFAKGFTAPQPQNLRDQLEGLYRQSGETQSETAGEMISPQGETGETVKRPSEMDETQYTARVSASGETGETISRNGETDGETGEISPDRVSRVCEMKRAGLNQTQIIAIEWGAKPGKSQAYLNAVEQYKAIIDRHWKD